MSHKTILPLRSQTKLNSKTRFHLIAFIICSALVHTVNIYRYYRFHFLPIPAYRSWWPGCASSVYPAISILCHHWCSAFHRLAFIISFNQLVNFPPTPGPSTPAIPARKHFLLWLTLLTLSTDVEDDDDGASLRPCHVDSYEVANID